MYVVMYVLICNLILLAGYMIYQLPFVFVCMCTKEITEIPAFPHLMI